MLRAIVAFLFIAALAAPAQAAQTNSALTILCATLQ